MARGTFVWDEVCAWPYALPYGLVKAPRVKRPRKKRTPRAKPDWLKTKPKSNPEK